MKSATFLCVILASLVAAAPSVAQPRAGGAEGAAPNQPVPPPPDVKLVTKVYDVRDFVRPTRDYPFESIYVPPMQIGGSRNSEGGGGGGGQNLFGGGGAAPQQGVMREGAISPDGLTATIVRTIAPHSWRDAGGNEGTITLQEGLLIVSQTEERQAQISDLLKQLGQQFGPSRTVTIKADWVLLPPGQLHAIVKGKSAPQEIDLEALAKQSLRARYSGQISCFNGQTVHIASVKGKTMIRDLQPVVAQQAVGYNADVTLAQAGATLQVTPQISTDASSAILDLQSLVTEWDEPDSSAQQKLPTTIPTNEGIAPWSLIDRQGVSAQQFRTTLRIPTGKPVLIGGMTMAPTLKSGDSSQLYLIIEITASQ